MGKQFKFGFTDSLDFKLYRNFSAPLA